MATEREQQAIIELVWAAMRTNDSNDLVNVAVDVRSESVEVRIAPKKHSVIWDWIFYPDSPAYISGAVFTEELFLAKVEQFMAEIGKHLILADADGVPV